MIQLKATFTNEDRVLWPGQFVTVAMTLSELTNIVVVPSQAVQTGQTNQFVYVVKPDPTNAAIQIAEERPVTIGIVYQGETVVQKGLATGETVVTDGQLRLTPGARVNIKSPTGAATPARCHEHSGTFHPAARDDHAGHVGHFAFWHHWF